ncbi:winged helix-turn-helix transcriptional regulator [Sulfobacillus thermosulfidooxidans]|uniref:Transcriptional regulator, HxlR family n=1 Tax=Sulfobacillus thermosulfidooxidans (strain DSM 9293 / VKM B-1269 / AT-1) TaxID=929705 RepID=A0A1W1WHY6_SULTA|nr:helix-turn-helix domain-containing protein [Sulfobacillus thermosulfidooxidans]OLZ10302.1 HxlR family transcriptional regulator [Sulfobacillus thermosulfidooxidans]OLZ13261.1 HxlR family transcriptional regulator [Sulfobacillus thermosulfidooxidans]OLZ21641.1 HxlR family transcriptional regulator [Sulfobacillus thermosulfidooxidans]SMC05928.1 transcriptional regulator, HxlR family [Sulfobacillus thermosulfidooxidans DSM 9293]
MDDLKICPKFEAAFALLGQRWTGLIIRALLSGQRRFSDITQMIPHLSDRMLAERLKALEAEGIVKRIVYPETPVRVEYELTDKGRELEPVMDQVQKWADKWYHYLSPELSLSRQNSNSLGDS